MGKERKRLLLWSCVHEMFLLWNTIQIPLYKSQNRS